MQFFTYVGIGFVAVFLGSIAVGFVRGLIARHKAKRMFESMTGEVKKGKPNF